MEVEEEKYEEESMGTIPHYRIKKKKTEVLMSVEEPPQTSRCIKIEVFSAQTLTGPGGEDS